MCMCLIILISSSRSKNTISLSVYFYKRCKHVVSIGLFCRSQPFYCLSYGSLELVFWFSPLHTSFILHIFSYNIWGHSVKCLLHSQRLQGVGRLPCMSGKIIKVCWVMCEGLGMEGGRGRAVARSWLAWGFSQRKLDSAWQTPISRTTVTFFHEDIKGKKDMEPSIKNGSQSTNVLCLASLPLTCKWLTQRQSKFDPEAKHACTDRPGEARFPSVPCDSSPLAVFLKSSGSSFLGHKELIQIFYITIIYIILLLFWILS